MKKSVVVALIATTLISCGEPTGPVSAPSVTERTSTGGPSVAAIASFTYSCNGLACNFDGTGSAGASTYRWDFGDGGTGGVPVHPRTYAVAGTYTVTLTTTPSGPGSVLSQEIVVTAPPPPPPPPRRPPSRRRALSRT